MNSHELKAIRMELLSYMETFKEDNKLKKSSFHEHDAMYLAGCIGKAVDAARIREEFEMVGEYQRDGREDVR